MKVLASLSLNRHLTYVAMTRHREDLGVYYGARSFAKAGGLIPILSRKNSKETTLDYDKGAFYRQALRFAEARGLHRVTVVRTLVRDQLEWTIRQKNRLAELGARLAAVAAKLGLVRGIQQSPKQDSVKVARPMVSGISTQPKSIDQAIVDKVAADPGLKKQWDEVSSRFHLVYAEPEAAFKAVNVDAMLKDGTVAKTTLAKIGSQPEQFGMLKGKTGVFASRADKQQREKAETNAPALARNLERYLRQRAEAERKFEVEERAVRLKVSIDIPALSANAKQTLERVRDAIDRNDLPAGLEFALADKMVKAELEGFARAVSERFGERTFLPLAAKEANGQTFNAVTAGMTAGQKAEVQSAWNSMRTVQQLAAHERTTVALKQAEALRQTKSQGLSLK
ncbi:Ti-type conjugative transfer relaxase TraA [compost metagenome]